MNILITGGAGYLGSTTVGLLLQSGHSVTVVDNLQFGGESLIPFLDHTRFSLVRTDIRDIAKLEPLLPNVEGVVHLAAVVGDPACAKNPELAREINEYCSLKLIDIASKAGVKRFIFASTCSNYGRMTETSEFASEDHPLRPVSLYAETKVAVEQRLLDRKNDPMTATVLRFATLYGLSARMRFDLTVNEFVMRLATDRRLTVFGEQFWRPYVHVADAARAIQTVLEAPAATVAHQVFNVGDTKENYRKLDLVNLAQKRIADTQIEYVHKTEDPRDYRVSFERIRTQLNFSITRDVPEGIDQIARAIENGIFENLASPRYYNS